MKRNAAIVGLALLVLSLSACSRAASIKGDSAPVSGHHEHGHHEMGGSEIQGMWRLNPALPTPKSNTRIQFMAHGPDGKLVTEFAVMHEKLLHLIVVSKDLSYFNHIHPDYDGEGMFTIDTTFPFGGEYRLFAEFQPEGGGSVVSRHAILLSGKADLKPLIPDTTLTKSTGQEIVTLSYDRLAAGEETNLTFHIADAKTKKPANNLEPYLGAAGHVVIISGDSEQYIHVHPVDAKGGDSAPVFHATFPAPGIYKVWGQFAREGRPITVSYTLQVRM
ncbi:hypothetical protein [Paenibacillus sp. BC26]|uniref:hypothetical protein n=1 Tax=Paenibacillus sp. BC26 TaxID=1881032 RepID=UPI0008ED6096|nr:hypothetical protein [Paenibacillus sp. BC26]SFT19925.1 hypothetical protein SAMN05428962_5104 [Paenibacillus sp. BC26]